MRCFFQRDLKVGVVPAVLFSVFLPMKNIIEKQKKLRGFFWCLIGAIWLNFQHSGLKMMLISQRPNFYSKVCHWI